jgi:predicted SAM-dependent methyltransferase
MVDTNDSFPQPSTRFGWTLTNALPGPAVDHIGNANDLSRFADGTFAELYASHVVEHLDYAGELLATLKEWLRVLPAGGLLKVSVPNLDVLAQLFLARDQLTPDERFMVMRMMFGGHIDQYDYHQVGLNEEFLASYLFSAGFTNIRRVAGFGLFNDTSTMLFKGVPISLNLIAERPHVTP